RQQLESMFSIDGGWRPKGIPQQLTNYKLILRRIDPSSRGGSAGHFVKCLAVVRLGFCCFWCGGGPPGSCRLPISPKSFLPAKKEWPLPEVLRVHRPGLYPAH